MVVLWVAGAIAACVFTTYMRWDAAAFSEIPLGLRGSRKPRKHAIMSVTGLTNTDDWLAALPRGARQTMRKVWNEGAKPWAAGRIFVRTVEPRDLRFSHLRVLYDHERRAYSALRAAAAAVLRFCVARMMSGSVDEYLYDSDLHKYVLVGWSHTVVKGDTLRGMWFYQISTSKKDLIWFHSLRVAVERAIIMPEVNWVDLGPSGTCELADVKTKFHFEDSSDWGEMGRCNYRGACVAPITYDELVRMRGTGQHETSTNYSFQQRRRERGSSRDKKHLCAEIFVQIAVGGIAAISVFIGLTFLSPDRTQ